MKKILGLDLGTTSIGWALVNEKENNEEQSSIIRLGVRVNPLTVDEKSNFEKGKDITTNADRTKCRSARRNLQRFKLRREALADCLKRHGLMTDETPLCETNNSIIFKTYSNRAKAVCEKIALDDFVRVLFMINKKRGYKSSRKLNTDDEGTLVDGMDVAKLLYNEQITPGEYLLRLFKKGKKTRPDFYLSDLKAELERIWDFQRTFYPEILCDALKEDLKGKSRTQSSAIFYAKYKVSTAKIAGKDKRLQELTWRTDALRKQLTIDEVAYVICSINGEINGSSQRLSMISDRSKLLYFNHQTIGQYLMQRLEENPNAGLKNIIFYRQDYEDEFNDIWNSQATYHKELTPELKKELKDIIFYQRGLKSCKWLINYCELEHEEIEVKTPEGKLRKITIGSKTCPKSSPLFQEFKIWQVLNNLQVSPLNSRRKAKRKKDEEPSLFSDEDMNTACRYLNEEEKLTLFKELSIKKELKKKDALKLLFENYKELDLNYKVISGNVTMASLYRAFQDIISLTGNGEFDFQAMPAEEAEKTVEEIFGGLGYKTAFLHFDASLHGKEFERQPAYRLWHLLYSYAGDQSKTGIEALVKRIQELCGFEPEYARILANISFIPDYGNLSSKAMRKILPYMQDGYEYSEACSKAGYRHSASSLTKEEINKKTYKTHLDEIKRNSLRNPIVEKILNQMVNVVNSVIDTYGSIDEIRIEMARELKKSKPEREDMSFAINKATKETERIKGILEQEFKIQHVTRNDIIRYRLYEELKPNGYKTLYSNTYIPREDLFSKKFDIEHIIPKARLFDDSYSNKTLELRDINIEKGNQTAYDFVLSKYGEEGLYKYEQRVEEFKKNNEQAGSKCRKLLMREADIPSDFLNRDLNDSQYIAKKAHELLREIVPTVTATTGSITNRLREDWKLVNVMKELNWEKYDKLGLTEEYKDKDGNTVRHIKDWTKRNDHRHHAMDALTIAFTKPSFIQYLNNLNARSNKGGSIYGIEQKELERENNKLVFIPPIDPKIFRKQAKEHLSNILISIKAKNKVVTKNVNKTKSKSGTNRKVQLTPRGQLHLETVYGKIRTYKSEEIKVGTKLTEELIAKVADKKIREALMQRLSEYGDNIKKAFQNISKHPIWLNGSHTKHVPEKVKIVFFEDIFTIRKAITPDIKIDKVIDSKIRRILQERLNEFGGEASKAFSNLDENPIWFNKDKGIAIKNVKIRGIAKGTAIRVKKDIHGKTIIGNNGYPVANDYVNTGNNHHVAIFRDKDGNLQEHIVSFYEATARAIQNLPIVDRNYNSEKDWKFLFSMKQNEYFVFPNPNTGFNPSEISLKDEKNYALISPNLFRVQKLSHQDYVFRHHLETNVDTNLQLRDITWKRITAVNNLTGAVKVRIDHLGRIVDVGEYK